MRKVFVVILLFFLFLSQISFGAIGDKSKNFTLKDLNGRVYKLSDFKGKVVFLNFFATWCPPCRAEIPSIIKMRNILKNKNNFVVIAISIDRTDTQNLVDFSKQNGINFLILHDKTGAVANEYGVYSIPATFIINKEGIIVKYELGYRDWADKEVIDYILRLLK